MGIYGPLVILVHVYLFFFFSNFKVNLILPEMMIIVRSASEGKAISELKSVYNNAYCVHFIEESEAGIIMWKMLS